MIRRACEDKYIQATESEHTTQCNLLCPTLVETPYIWNWEEEKRPISNDVRDGVADKESVDVHGACRVHRFVPLQGR